MSDTWHELEVDLRDDLLTAAEAADVCHVRVEQIWQWKRRGHLRPAGHDEMGRPMYRGMDVLQAEARAWSNSRRTQACNLARGHATPAA